MHHSFIVIMHYKHTRPKDTKYRISSKMYMIFSAAASLFLNLLLVLSPCLLYCKKRSFHFYVLSTLWFSPHAPAMKAPVMQAAWAARCGGVLVWLLRAASSPRTWSLVLLRTVCRQTSPPPHHRPVVPAPTQP